jgi:hypothetical protein
MKEKGLARPRRTRYVAVVQSDRLPASDVTGATDRRATPADEFVLAPGFHAATDADYANPAAVARFNAIIAPLRAIAEAYRAAAASVPARKHKAFVRPARRRLEHTNRATACGGGGPPSATDTSTTTMPAAIPAGGFFVPGEGVVDDEDRRIPLATGRRSRGLRRAKRAENPAGRADHLDGPGTGSPRAGAPGDHAARTRAAAGLTLHRRGVPDLARQLRALVALLELPMPPDSVGGGPTTTTTAPRGLKEAP